MDIIPYQRKHLVGFQPGQMDKGPTAQLYCEQGWEGKAASIREDGRTLGIVGIAVLRGTAHVWAVLSDELRRRPVALCHIGRASLGNIRNLPSVSRVEISIDPGFDKARRWAEWLGFKAIDSRRMEYGSSPDEGARPCGEF